ncbi:acyl--CoA ligase [Evansella sp. LMS18]|jgi:acyl-CoA synthetase (AMP-forming)/AMP-acid ligase II|uniref:class I adenylate-forming enzyme family protein n=1 Tax=Evansella sp. LMS18 TaxID=2924033 RepID=UPI0020CFFC9A|nr:class I adenylate-forming enzyme family protein [Evansella sp. LMS18]UTR12066.1 acyl--CoA ligase [Evansella sp. LMS18]
MSSNEWKLPLLNSYIDKWAEEKPDTAAMVQVEDGKTVSYKKFSTLIDFFALRLLDMGIKKGDRVATMLVTFPEHFALMYACFKIGAIIAPLDPRLQNQEVVRDLEKIKPKAFFFLGDTPNRDFRETGAAVQKGCPYVEHFVQFTPDPKPGDILSGAVSITELMDKKKLISLKLKDIFSKNLKKAYEKIDPQTPTMIIYTTGTTGPPKPALLTHENIIIQNEILVRGMNVRDSNSEFKLVINLPPSHVGGTTEAPMTTFFLGGTALMLRIFNPKLTAEAIDKYKATAVGMIPTQYRMIWDLPDYEKYNMDSLEFAIYAGSAVDEKFLSRLSEMAPKFGCGLGMTENAGFATFTPEGISFEEMAGQVGRSFPDLAEVSVRAPMKEDGSAGEELEDGEVGEICYHPPIVFAGYYDQPEETAKTVSNEGILYTGDLGHFKDMGTYRALYLKGRRKFVIKQKGYNVFPDEVQNFISSHPKVAVTEVVGIKHDLYDEGIFAFIKPQPGETVTVKEIEEHCKNIASYKRPQYIEVWPHDKEFPLTRVAKVDKIELKTIAGEIVEKLRKEGKWDRTG